MQPPAVREVNSLIDEYSKTFDPHRQLIDADIIANDQAGSAQAAGLEAKKGKAFKQIGQNSQNKGMWYSGLSTHEEAEYTSDTYLPALAALQQTIASTRSGLLGKKADLDAQARTQALATHEQDRTNKFNWEVGENDRRSREEEARRAREFEASEAEKNRQAQAREGAANRAASASSQSSTRELFASELAKNAGKDGKVNPGTYNALKNQYVAAGYGSYKDFHDKYWKFANNKHWWDYR